MKKFKTLLLPALAVLAAAGLGACQPSGSKAGEEQSAAVQPVESAAEHSGAAAEASIKENASVVTDDHRSATAAPVSDYTGDDVKRDVALFYAKSLEAVKKCKTRDEAAAAGEHLYEQVRKAYDDPKALGLCRRDGVGRKCGEGQADRALAAAAAREVIFCCSWGAFCASCLAFLRFS